MDLNTASNEQLELYRAKVAEKVKIDPLMLDYAWMKDPESGLKSRVLYAKRGVAELLRQDFGITIDSLTMSESNGYVAFITAASRIVKPSTGERRQEIAVGAAYIAGLKGDKIAHAVMTAQTRAVRRVTLQLVGGGILDETEVQGQEDLYNAPSASAALPVGIPIVFPTVAPANQPGTDITPAKVEYQVPVASLPATIVVPPHVGDTVKLVPVQTEMPVGQINADGNVTPAEEKPKRTRKRRNAVNIANPEDVKEAVAATCPICGKTIGEHAFKNSELVCPPKVTTDSTVTIKSTTIAQLQTPVQEAMAPQTPEAVAKAQADFEAGQAKLRTDAAVFLTRKEEPAAPVAAPPAPNVDGFKNKLRAYANDVLPKGGMLPSDGIGGITMKLRAYARKVTGAPDMNSLTTEQWEVLFEELDTRVANGGPAALVKDINEALGVV